MTEHKDENTERKDELTNLKDITSRRKYKITKPYMCHIL